MKDLIMIEDHAMDPAGSQSYDKIHKKLYQQTLDRDQRIRNFGYNLIVRCQGICCGSFTHR